LSTDRVSLLEHRRIERKPEPLSELRPSRLLVRDRAGEPNGQRQPGAGRRGSTRAGERVLSAGIAEGAAATRVRSSSADAQALVSVDAYRGREPAGDRAL